MLRPPVETRFHTREMALRAVAGVSAGFALGYCFPKIDALSPYAEPVEQLLRKLPLPKPEIKLT